MALYPHNILICSAHAGIISVIGISFTFLPIAQKAIALMMVCCMPTFSSITTSTKPENAILLFNLCQCWC